MYALQDDGYTAQYNKSTELRRRWKQPGDITDVPRYVYGQTIEYGGCVGPHGTHHLTEKFDLTPNWRTVRSFYALETALIVGSVSSPSVLVKNHRY